MDLIPKDIKLADTVSLFEGSEKQQFLAFVSRMLQWEPEKRSLPKDLIEDPFLVLEEYDDEM